MPEQKTQFFYAWDNVWSRNDLTLGEKAVYSLVDGFTHTEGYFAGSNEYIGKRLGMLPRNVRVILSSLIEVGLIDSGADRQ